MKALMKLLIGYSPKTRKIAGQYGNHRRAEAVLTAGIFHREEVPIETVKKHMRDEGIETR